MKKKCNVCGKTKPLSGFRRNRTKKDGLQCTCTDCDKKRQKKWYTENKNYALDKNKERNKRLRERGSNFIIGYLKSHPCCVCGETDIVVLEFDHIDGSEKDGLVTMFAHNGDIIKTEKEINKCQVLCANCHRKKTAKEYNWGRVNH